MNSLINKNSAEIITELERLSGGNLFQKDDLEIIIKKALDGNKTVLLEELAFNSKFAGSLLKIIQKKEPSNDEAFFKKAISEYQESLQKIKNGINELIEGDQFVINIFSEKYLRLNRNCLENLNSLCADLGYVKLYLNDLKREV